MSSTEGGVEGEAGARPGGLSGVRLCVIIGRDISPLGFPPLSSTCETQFLSQIQLRL